MVVDWSTEKYEVLNRAVPVREGKSEYHHFRALRIISKRAKGEPDAWKCIAIGAVITCNSSSRCFNEGAPWFVAGLKCKSPNSSRNRYWTVVLCSGTGQAWQETNPKDILDVVEAPTKERAMLIASYVSAKSEADAKREQEAVLNQEAEKLARQRTEAETLRDKNKTRQQGLNRKRGKKKKQTDSDSDNEIEVVARSSSRAHSKPSCFAEESVAKANEEKRQRQAGRTRAPANAQLVHGCST